MIKKTILLLLCWVAFFNPNESKAFVQKKQKENKNIENKRSIKFIKHKITLNDIVNGLSAVYGINVTNLKLYNTKSNFNIGDSIVIPADSIKTGSRKAKSSIDDEGVVWTKRDTVFVIKMDTSSLNHIKPSSFTLNNSTPTFSNTTSILSLPNDNSNINLTHNRTPEPKNKPKKELLKENTPIITYTVKSGDNIGTIAENFNTTVEEIKKLNKLRKAKILVNQKLKIRSNSLDTLNSSNLTSLPKTIKTPLEDNPTLHQKRITTLYRVKRGQNLSGVAKKFNTETDSITIWNKLSSDRVQAGQMLKIKTLKYVDINGKKQLEDDKNPLEQAIPSLAEDNFGDDYSKEDSLLIANATSERKITVNQYGLREVSEKGVAQWMPHEQLSENKSLALHRTAPIGTVMKVSNPRTGRSVFVKIVGKFSETNLTKNSILIVSKSAAIALGVLKTVHTTGNTLRFLVHVTYGAPKE